MIVNGFVVVTKVSTVIPPSLLLMFRMTLYTNSYNMPIVLSFCRLITDRDKLVDIFTKLMINRLIDINFVFMFNYR